ncbi:MAG: helix-turn-helix domain-containing protein [Acetivibrionales bacterium]|jgi:excisionase family DNA binding protein
MRTVQHTTTVSDLLGQLRAECEGPLERDEWLSPQRISEELTVHLNSVYRWIRSKELAAYNLGKEGKTYYRIRRSDLEHWLEKRSNQLLDV